MPIGRMSYMNFNPLVEVFCCCSFFFFFFLQFVTSRYFIIIMSFDENVERVEFFLKRHFVEYTVVGQ